MAAGRRVLDWREIESSSGHQFHLGVALEKMKRGKGVTVLRKP
jgi:hypothetical protein